MANSTGSRPVEPLHNEHIHVEKKRNRWLLLLPIAAVGLLGAYLLTSHAPSPSVITTTTTTTTTTQVTPRLVTYKDQKWAFKGNPETFLPGEVQAIGKSAEGDDLYFNPKKGYTSGKGSVHIANAISTPSGRIYLKTANGQFQPLFLKP